MIKETMLLKAVHAFIPETLKFVKAFGPYERELKRTKRLIDQKGELHLLVSGEKDEADYSSSLTYKADMAAKAVFALHRKCCDTYGIGFIDCNYPIINVRDKQELICEVDSILMQAASGEVQKAK